MELYDHNEERAVFARLLPLLILFFMLLLQFGLHACCDESRRCVCDDSGSSLTVLEPFNEQRVWIDQDVEGHTLICKQRVLLSPYFYRDADIYCSRAVPMAASVAGAKRGDICWKADGIVLCEESDGTVFKP